MIPLRQTNDLIDTGDAKGSSSLTVRRFTGGNWRGLWTLLVKEIHRFFKIWEQTLVSPLIMTLLFYAVFAIGIGNKQSIGHTPFLTFVIPGLVMMSAAQSAFSNGSISLILSKIQGNIVDIIMSPLSPFEMMFGYVVSGVVRGVIVAILSLAILLLFTPMSFASPFAIIYFCVMGSLMLSSIGVITGLCGTRFDHIGAIQNFIVMPATFLSGTFFTVSQLPEEWRAVCFLNPFYYMIDGFRYGFIGVSDTPLTSGIAFLFCINIVLLYIVYWLFAKGSCLRS